MQRDVAVMCSIVSFYKKRKDAVLSKELHLEHKRLKYDVMYIQVFLIAFLSCVFAFTAERNFLQDKENTDCKSSLK